MNETFRIGIVGIGAMGFAIARNLQARRCAPVVRDIDPTTVEAARRLGLAITSSPAELAAHVDLVVIVVVDAVQIEPCCSAPTASSRPSSTTARCRRR